MLSTLLPLKRPLVRNIGPHGRCPSKAAMRRTISPDVVLRVRAADRADEALVHRVELHEDEIGTAERLDDLQGRFM